MLFNTGPDNFLIEAGDPIAQLIIEKAAYPCVAVVEEFDKIGERGSAGFGSSSLPSPSKNPSK